MSEQNTKSGTMHLAPVNVTCHITEVLIRRWQYVHFSINFVTNKESQTFRSHSHTLFKPLLGHVAT